METYLVFAGANFYPQEGIKDLHGQFSDCESAMLYIMNTNDIDWWQVVKITKDNSEIVLQGLRREGI